VIFPTVSRGSGLEVVQGILDTTSGDMVLRLIKKFVEEALGSQIQPKTVTEATSTLRELGGEESRELLDEKLGDIIDEVDKVIDIIEDIKPVLDMVQDILS